jgi:hypothetical protein
MSNIADLKIGFVDCWEGIEEEKRLPESDRWIATLEPLKIVVTAPTKEMAFEEVMISIRVLAMYANELKPNP